MTVNFEFIEECDYDERLQIPFKQYVKTNLDIIQVKNNEVFFDKTRNILNFNIPVYFFDPHIRLWILQTNDLLMLKFKPTQFNCKTVVVIVNNILFIDNVKTFFNQDKTVFPLYNGLLMEIKTKNLRFRTCTDLFTKTYPVHYKYYLDRHIAKINMDIFQKIFYEDCLGCIDILGMLLFETSKIVILTGCEKNKNILVNIFSLILKNDFITHSINLTSKKRILYIGNNICNVPKNFYDINLLLYQTNHNFNKYEVLKLNDDANFDEIDILNFIKSHVSEMFSIIVYYYFHLDELHKGDKL